MANNTKTEIPISHYTYGSYKLHLIKSYNDIKILCGQKYTTTNFIFEDITKYHPYNKVCKNCLKKLPADVLNRLKYNFIVAKLKAK